MIRRLSWLAHEVMGEPRESPRDKKPQGDLEDERPLPEKRKDERIDRLLIRRRFGRPVGADESVAVPSPKTLRDLTWLPHLGIAIGPEYEERQKVDGHGDEKQQPAGAGQHVSSIEHGSWFVHRELVTLNPTFRNPRPLSDSPMGPIDYLAAC